MKKLLFLLLINHSLFANDYFVKVGGNNTLAGTSDATAWADLTKVNAVFSTLLPGDNIFFNRGDVFYGTLVINKSGTSGNPITISAYGIGAKPIITGFTTLTGWTNEGGGIYSKVITSAAQTNMVTIDGVQYGMGRYPDASYLSYESFATNVSITDNGLGISTNWTGAEAVIRKNDWTLDRCTITSHVGDVITYTSRGSGSNGTTNFGYFFQNDIRTLTTYGEWYHDAGTGKLSVYFGADPSTLVVKVATVNKLLTNAGFDYITIDNLIFTGSIDHLVHFTSSTDFCTIQNCDLSFGGKTGAFITGGTNTSLTANTVSRCNRTGISTDATNTTISANTISNIGLISGQALDADGYVGIYTPGNGVNINHNLIINTGYNGIALRYTGTALIQYNFIDTTCKVLDDGAGIYTGGPNVAVRVIDHNIVLNTIGNSDGTSNSTNFSTGIYLDEVATNVRVTGNTTANIVYAGIKLHKANENVITDNLFYNSNYCMELTNTSGANLYGNLIRRNVSFAKTATQYCLRLGSVSNNNTAFAIADSNYYARPILDSLSITTNQPSTGVVNRTLANYISYIGQDVSSKKAFKAINNVGELDFQYNATAEPVVYSYPGLSKVNVAGIVYNNSVTIAPYSSVVLISNGSVTGTRYYIRQKL